MNYLNLFDNSILEFIRANMHCGFLDIIMPFVSLINNHGEIWILTAVIFMCILPLRKSGICLAAALLLGFLVCNLIIKPAVARIRPCDINAAVNLLVARPDDFSFPSGHTVSSFAAVPVLWKTKRRYGIAALILAVLIAFSRLYLYVHYPTDILGGIIIGLAAGFTVASIKFEKTKHGAA